MNNGLADILYMCDSCRNNRFGKFLDILTYPLFGGTTAFRNWKYCKDVIACRDRALRAQEAAEI